MKNKIKYLIILVFVAIHTAKAEFVKEPTTQLPKRSSGEEQLVNNLDGIANISIVFVVVASLVGFIISLIQFAIAGGNEGSLERARRTSLYSLIGLTTASAGYVIFKLVNHLYLK